jgi:two-component system cell cycle sensor histidine kinase/response regulator CckA
MDKALIQNEPLDRWLHGDGLAALEGITGKALDVIGVVDRDLRIRYLNWTAEGLRREDMVGGDAIDLAPPDYREIAAETYRGVLRSGEGARFDIVSEVGETVRMWDVRVGPIQFEEEIVGLIITTTDVTEQRRAHADRDRFFSLSLDMLVVATPDGYLKRVNSAFGEALGYEVRDCEGRPFVSFIHPDDVESTRAAYEAVLRGEPTSGFENRYRHADGSYRTLSWRAALDPVTGDVYAVARDITERRAAETQLRHAQKMEAVGQLAGGVAHDFNNLLQAILGHTHLASARVTGDAELAARLADVRSAAERAADLTRQLLTFSRRQTLRPVAVDLNEVTRGLMPMLQRLIPASIAIDFIPHPGLPAVDADPTQIEQVIVNLCVNARDAMEDPGGMILRTDDVLLERPVADGSGETEARRYVRLSVTDTGTGIPPEVRERIFDPFFTTKEPQRGTGLGLATVFGIVEQHRGMVEVRSQVGEGTTFEIYLPATAAPAGHETSALPTDPSPGHETVLVAEDEAMVRRAVVEMLQRSGYRTLVAVDGRDAIRLLDEYEGPVHLALLDVVMPELGGIDTWEELRRRRPELRVLFASGYADARVLSRLPAGTEILGKPFDLNELLARIRETLDR